MLTHMAGVLSGWRAGCGPLPLLSPQGVNFWQMDLRNNAERFEMLGNLMSGLFCPVRERHIPPAIIRKPTTRPPASLLDASSRTTTTQQQQLEGSRPGTAAEASGGLLLGGGGSSVPMAFKTARLSEAAAKTQRDLKLQQQQQSPLTRTARRGADGGAVLHGPGQWRPSKLILAAKRRYRRTLSSVRPHEVDQALLDGLTLELPDLFEWALESSAEYFKEIDDFDGGAAADSNGGDTYRMMTGGGLMEQCLAKGMDAPFADPDAKPNQQAAAETLVAASLSPTTQQHGEKRAGPVLEVGPSCRLLFQASSTDQLVKQEVRDGGAHTNQHGLALWLAGRQTAAPSSLGLRQGSSEALGSLSSSLRVCLSVCGCVCVCRWCCATLARRPCSTGWSGRSAGRR